MGKDAKSDSRGSAEGKMNVNKIMPKPMQIKTALESRGDFGIHIGSTSVAGKMAAKGTVKSFKMIGMNLTVINLSVGVRMLTPRGLILGSFGTKLMGLVAFILDAYRDSLWQHKRWPSAFTCVKSFTTNGKEQVSISAFTICKEGQFISL